MMRMLLILSLFLPIFACKKKSGSSDTPTTEAAPTSCDAYSPSGNNLDLAGAALTPLPAIDATELQVDSLKVTVAPYKSGKDNFNALSFEVVGKSTSNVNLVSDYLQYKVCMEQNGSGGQKCLCNNGTSTCPYQAAPSGNATSALFNEYSTGDYQIPDPYTTSWEVPVPVALSGVLSTTARLCVRDNRKTSAANCGPWAPAVLRQVSGNYTQVMGQLKQTIQQISTEEGALAFSLVQSAKTYQQALSSIPYANQNNEERSLSLYASNFINFPDSTRQVLQNRDLYTEMLQEVKSSAAGGSSTGLAGGTTASCAPVVAAIQSITASPVTDAGISTLTETVVYTYTQNGTLTSTLVQVLPGETTTVTINSTETATIVGPTVTQTDIVTNNVTQVVTNNVTQVGSTTTVTPQALLIALQQSAQAVVQSATEIQSTAGSLHALSEADMALKQTALSAADKALDDANKALVAANDTTSDGTAAVAALSQAQSDLSDAATKLAAAQQAIAATDAVAQMAALQTQNAADQQIALHSQVNTLLTRVAGVENRLSVKRTVFNEIPTSYNLSDTNDLAKKLALDAVEERKTAEGKLTIAQTDVDAAKGSLSTLTDTNISITTQAVLDADVAESKADGAVDLAAVAVETAQQKAAAAAAEIASAKASNNSIGNKLKNPVVFAAAATVAIGLVVTIVAGRKLDVARQTNKIISPADKQLISSYRENRKKFKEEFNLRNKLARNHLSANSKYQKAEILSGKNVDEFSRTQEGRTLQGEVNRTKHVLAESELRIKDFTQGKYKVEKPAVMEKSTVGAKVGVVVGVAMLVGGILVGVLQGLNIGALNLAASSPRDQANLTFLTAMTQLQNRYQALNTAFDECNLELTSELALAGTATLANCRMP